MANGPFSNRCHLCGREKRYANVRVRKGMVRVRLCPNCDYPVPSHA